MPERAEGQSASADGERLETDGGDSDERRLDGTSLTERVAALHEAATDIVNATTVDEACQRTVAAAADILDFELCSIMYNEGDLLVPRALSEDAPPDGARPMEVDEGLAGHTYLTGESFVVDDVDADEHSEPTTDRYRSGISVPIDDHGVFQAVAEETDAFVDRDVQLAELLVAHTGTVLDRIERENRLQRTNERLANFAGLVSHDLRNPLSTARGQAELALETGDLERVETVVDALDRMDALVDDLLVLAREGEIAGETRRLSLRTVGRCVWEGIDSGDARLVFESDPSVEASETHLEHLLANLFRNAVEHGRPGEETDVTVRIGPIPEGEGFYVADDGVGISRDHRESITDPGVTSGAEGTGFGLVIVAEIAAALDWELSVTDSDAGGARFEFVTV